MTEALVITPVKDSLETTKQTIKAIVASHADVEYVVFNDFSGEETYTFLEKAKSQFGIRVIHLSEVTKTPSPNYKLVLEMAQKMAIEKKCPLIIIESDVVVKSETIQKLIEIQTHAKNAGMVGAITVDIHGNYNFPYTFEKTKNSETIITSHSLSFCCTLLTPAFLESFDFKELSLDKDWFDVFISRQSKKLGFDNYLAKGLEVLHLPHSSRPWKQLKYKNPFLYYIKKLFQNRDRI